MLPISDRHNLLLKLIFNVFMYMNYRYKQET